MKQFFLQAAINYPFRDKATEFIREPFGSAVVGAAFLGAVAGGITYNIEEAREGHTPIAFSEVGKTIKKLEGQGKTVPPLTKFYASTNDVLMKVFEANNIAHENNRVWSRSHFASELEYQMNSSFKVHRQIPEYAKEFPEISQKAMEALGKITAAQKDLLILIEELKRVWKYESEDITHRESWSAKECDIMDEEDCEDVQHSRTVYDYTIHEFEYDPRHGEKANQLMAEFLKKHPDLELERLVLSE